MLYHAYELSHAAVAPYRSMARLGKQMFGSAYNPLAHTPAGRTMFAAFDVFEFMTRRHQKPAWRLDHTIVDGVQVPVTVREIRSRPFCNLLHFQRDPEVLREARGRRSPDPRLLIVAPMSGHYATLLRGTVEAFLPDHEVYITDWADARDVPLVAGRFDLNSYIDYVIDALRVVGPSAHVLGVCQPGPPVLAAVSLMSEDGDPALPASMTFIGSPIDSRRSPTVPNEFAKSKPMSWFRRHLIHTVPWPNAGFMRCVYPGFLQLGGFISMNRERHTRAHQEYFNNLIRGDQDSAARHREFYREYLAVQDLTADFYLQTIRDVFKKHKLARGKFKHRGRRVRPERISKVALMTVEGERDDISGIGQTQAAHDLCANIPESMRFDHVQPEVGHYGVFSGRRFSAEVKPRIAEFIRAHFSVRRERAYQKQNPGLIQTLPD